MDKLEENLFYALEKAIKTYRQFAQKRINDAGIDITIDQWLILKTIQDNPEYSQHQLAETVFKDFASVTRMVELLVKKAYLIRNVHPLDRRRFALKITDLGMEILQKVYPIVAENRKLALVNFSSSDIETLKQQLNDLITNCQ